jgi:hypothetical protein
MNHLFIITSAINTRFGHHTREDRVLQTLHTLKSVYEKAPGAKIVVVESSAIPLEQDIVDKFQDSTHCFINMSGNEMLADIHEKNENWDIVKNVSEIICFHSALKMLDNSDMLTGIDRVHKLSGRYRLNDKFDLNLYEKQKNKIIVGTKLPTPFNKVVDIPYQYVSRLWSWPIKHHTKVKKFYSDAFTEMDMRLRAGRYADIEHLLYKNLPPKLVYEAEFIGVEGNLGQNNRFVQN